MCTELPDSFFRMKGYAGAGWGLIQGHRVAGEPLENCQKTAGGHWPLGCVLPGAWRVSKSQGHRGGGGARETPRTVSAGGVVNTLGGWS